MQKREFIKKLKGELQWHLSTAELRRILQEYDGYFTVSAANGSDEATAAAELGDPTLVASEILSERGIVIVEVRHNKIRTILAFIILAISIWLYAINPIEFMIIDNRADDGTLYNVSMAFRLVNLLVLLPTTLALLLGFRKKDCSGNGNTGLFFGVNIVAVAIIWVVWYCIFYLPLITTPLTPDAPTVRWLGHYVSPNAFGLVLGTRAEYLSIITAVFLVGVMRRISHGQLIYISLLYLNCAGLFGIYEFMIFSFRMSRLANPLQNLGGIMPHMAIGVLISVAVAILLLLHRRRVSV